LEDEVVKALEQVWDTRAPEIVVHRSFDWFCERKLDALLAPRDGRSPKALIAHPGGAGLRTCTAKETGRILIAIGPERGWSEEEVSRFEARSFEHIGLGERVLRVEIALVYLLGRLGIAG
jgi:RsmE family RNA methyltransferase